MQCRVLILQGLVVSTAFVTGQSARGSSNPTCGGIATERSASSIIFGDIDGDGLKDALVIGMRGHVALLMNFGDGRFDDITEASGLAGLAASCALLADLDGDALPDLYLGSSEVRAWRNLGNGSFEPIVSGIDHDLVDLAVRAVDQDEDGLVELHVQTEVGELVYRNLGQGRFDRLDLPLVVAPASLGWAPPEAADGLGGEAESPAKRAEQRILRWIAGSTLGPAPSSAQARTAGTFVPGAPGSVPFTFSCVGMLNDSAGGGCLEASSIPALGKLYPLSSSLFVDAATGNVGLGTTSPNESLQVGDFLVTNEDSYIELRTTGGPGQEHSQGLRMRSSNSSFGFDIEHDDSLKGLNFRRWDNGAPGDSELFINRLNGNIGVGTTFPGAVLDVKSPDGVLGLRVTVDEVLGAGGTGIVVQGGSSLTNVAGDGVVSTGGGEKGDGARGVIGIGGSGFNGTDGGDGVEGRGGFSSGGSPGGNGVVGVPGAGGGGFGLAVFAEGDFGGTGAKYFIQPHPLDASLEIRFVCLEGNESGTYFRGSARTVGGRAVIEVPEEFRLVTSASGVTVQTTPVGARSDLWVESKDLQRIVVRSSTDTEFDYFVNGIRRGFDELEVYAPNRSFVPTVRGVPFGAQYPEALRRDLVENGILNADYTPNEETAAHMGWKLTAPEDLPSWKQATQRR